MPAGSPRRSSSRSSRLVKEVRPSKLSPMPEGLLNVLREDEVLDLLAYLLSRGDPNHPMFRK